MKKIISAISIVTVAITAALGVDHAKVETTSENSVCNVQPKEPSGAYQVFKMPCNFNWGVSNKVIRPK